MADHGTARFVSGEMMAARLMSGSGAASVDVIDADYVEVTPEPRQARTSSQAAPPVSKRAGMAILDRREKPAARRGPTRGGALFWLTGGMLAIAAFWVSGGHAMLRSEIALTTGQNTAELEIANVTSRTEIVEGATALLVDGDIRNVGDASGRVPALAVQVLSEEGETIVYRLGTLRTPLAPGAKYSFSGRLDMPKDGVKTVSVTFDQ